MVLASVLIVVVGTLGRIQGGHGGRCPLLIPQIMYAEPCGKAVFIWRVRHKDHTSHTGNHTRFFYRLLTKDVFCTKCKMFHSRILGPPPFSSHRSAPVVLVILMNIDFVVMVTVTVYLLPKYELVF